MAVLLCVRPAAWGLWKWGMEGLELCAAWVEGEAWVGAEVPASHHGVGIVELQASDEVAGVEHGALGQGEGDDAAGRRQQRHHHLHHLDLRVRARGAHQSGNQHVTPPSLPTRRSAFRKEKRPRHKRLCATRPAQSCSARRRTSAKGWCWSRCEPEGTRKRISLPAKHDAHAHAQALRRRGPLARPDAPRAPRAGPGAAATFMRRTWAARGEAAGVGLLLQQARGLAQREARARHLLLHMHHVALAVHLEKHQERPPCVCGHRPAS